MAMASYFFAGTKEEALMNDGLSSDPSRRFEFYRVHDIALKALFTILTGSESVEFEEIANEDYMDITYKLPDVFVNEILKVEESEIDSIAKKYMSCADAPYNNLGDTVDLIKSLKKAAGQVSELNNLYFWIGV